MSYKHAALRIRCPCGRNLADVAYDEGNPDFTVDKLTVLPRPNVKQDDWRPWHEANQKKPSNPAPPGSLDRLIARLASRRAGEPELVDDWDPGEWVPARPELYDVDGERIGDAADMHHRTYTWHCRCGLNHTRRHSRIGAVWQEWAGRENGRPRVVVLGQHF